MNCYGYKNLRLECDQCNQNYYKDPVTKKCVLSTKVDKCEFYNENNACKYCRTNFKLDSTG